MAAIRPPIPAPTMMIFRGIGELRPSIEFRDESDAFNDTRGKDCTACTE